MALGRACAPIAIAAARCRRRRRRATIREMMSFIVGEPVPDEYVADDARGDGARQRRRARSGVGRRCAAERRASFPRRRDRRGHVGTARRDPPRAGRYSVRRHREERRGRRHVAREQLSGLPGRRRQPLLLLLLRAQPRLAGVLLAARRAARVLRALRRCSTACASASASAPRSSRRAATTRRRAGEVRSACAGRARGDDRGECADQRRRPAQPPAHPRHSGPRVVRRTGVSLRASGSTSTASPASAWR